VGRAFCSPKLVGALVIALALVAALMAAGVWDGPG
jgi:hypothetical protein